MRPSSISIERMLQQSTVSCGGEDDVQEFINYDTSTTRARYVPFDVGFCGSLGLPPSGVRWPVHRSTPSTNHPLTHLPKDRDRGKDSLR